MGFTLIELLAVIVILAVLALIATPIVLNIIDDSKESATLRSSENYIKAIEFSIAKSVMKNKKLSDGTYNVMSNGNICLGTITNSTCDNELIVEVSGETPERGTITINSRKIANYRFTYSSGNVTTNQICKFISGKENEVGSKYECEVKPETKFNFYVLSKEDDGTANLIMERNICDDGSLATTDNRCYVQWMSDSQYGCGVDGDNCSINDKGPVTAITYLYNSTKSWQNVSPLTYTYKDIESRISRDSKSGYISFISVDGIASITSLKGDIVTIGTNDTRLKARLPIYSSDTEKTEISSSNGTNEYLYENLDSGCFDGAGWQGYGQQPTNHINGIQGYWTLTSDGNWYRSAVLVFSCGYLGTNPVYNFNSFGIRPVINVKL